MVVYNALGVLMWGAVLVALAESWWRERSLERVFKETATLVAMVQTTAILEIIHSATGLVHSPVLSNIIQVGTRSTVIWLAVASGAGETGMYLAMVVAWGVSDMTRYLYYISVQVDRTSRGLLWCRYSFFLVLYPVGAGGEVWLLNLVRLKEEMWRWPLGVALVVYPVGFLYMYLHMLGQRKKALRREETKIH
uniref:very-long-chain (3R)-3-hydroxyacyl-CoA dehydratase n=1 Tax=Arcella intermedia TaxID=1963864 RepID=A0A6B2LJJ1_9EUKA